MNAQEAIAYIHSVSWKGSVPGLRRTRALLEKMGNPERKLQFIHIAGTNGKGSTAAMLASDPSRRQATGRACSPRPTSPASNERMQVRRRGDSRRRRSAEITARRSAPWPTAMAGPAPTEFELVTCRGPGLLSPGGSATSSCWRPGLGGALDATNVIDPARGLRRPRATSALDHTQVLGEHRRGNRPDEGRHLQAGRAPA